MRFLHTADWHLGRTIRGRSRQAEFHDVLAEVHGIAVAEHVDVVIVAGDIFDSASPGPGTERLLTEALRALAGAGIEVLLVAGNHDSPGRLGALGRLSELVGIRVQHQVLGHADGGIVTFERGGERAQVGAIPWVLERDALDAAEVLGAEHEGRQTYHDQVAAIYQHMTEGFEDGAIHLLAGHVFIDGARIASVDGSERRLHIDKTYGLMAASLPSSPQYIALGHVHEPQQVTNAPNGNTFYSGSLLQLDFGERGQQKVVRIVDARPGRPVEQHAVPLTRGRPLVELRGDVEAVLAQAERASDAWTRVILEVERPEPGVADRVRQAIPNAVDVKLDYDREEAEEATDALQDLSEEELFARYYGAQHGVPPSTELLALFRELVEEARAPA